MGMIFIEMVLKMNKISIFFSQTTFFTCCLRKSILASKTFWTRANPTSPLHPEISDPQHILRDSRKTLSSTSSTIFQYPSSIDIPDHSQQASPSPNPEPEKGKEEQDLAFHIRVTQLDNFQVYTNPLSSKKFKNDFLHSGGFSLKYQLTPYTPLTSRIPFHQLKSNSPPSPPSQVNPKMEG